MYLPLNIIRLHKSSSRNYHFSCTHPHSTVFPKPIKVLQSTVHFHQEKRFSTKLTHLPQILIDPQIWGTQMRFWINSNTKSGTTERSGSCNSLDRRVCCGTSKLVEFMNALPFGILEFWIARTVTRCYWEMPKTSLLWSTVWRNTN